MSSRIFQSVILQMKDATKRCFGVADEQGNVIASSDLSMMGYAIEEIRPSAAEAVNELFTAGGRTCRALGGGQPYYVFVEGTDELARSVCILAAVALGEAKSGYDEKHDAATFVKNIISDNILPGDVYVRAKELHFSADTPRAVYIVRQEEGAEVAVLEYLQTQFPARDKDFVLSMSETDVVVIRELPASFDSAELERAAVAMRKNLETDIGVKCVVGIGSPVMHLRELAGGQGLRHRKDRGELREPGHRPYHLPAPHHPVRDVFGRDLQEEPHRGPGRRDSLHHQQVL